jgi:hypothetical protein
MNLMNQDHGCKSGGYHRTDRTRRHQQESNGERTSIDVEMSERMHEILHKERRAGHEHPQRQVLVIKAEGFPKQLDEESERGSATRRR